MYRILMADDEPMALYSAAHAFPWAQYGFDEPVTTTEPKQALELLRTQTFDAAIVDIRMPDLTGIDLIRICRDEEIPTVFVVLSGYADFNYVQSAMRLQAFDYCLKPVMPEAAEDALARLSQRIYETRRIHDPATIRTLGTADPLPELFAHRGLTWSDGMLSLALITADDAGTLTRHMQEFSQGLLLWADDTSLLVLTAMPEAELRQTLARLPGFPCCYTQPVMPDLLNPARQYQLDDTSLLVLTAMPEAELRQTLARLPGFPCCYTQPVMPDLLNPARQYQLLAKMLAARKPGQPPLALRVNDCHPAFFELLDYVDHHLQEELSLQQLATRFHLNYTYCSELFRSITGQNFTKYMTSHRMEQVARLMNDTALSLAEVSRQAGYSNYNHFSATFKAYFGQTPGAYRSQLQHKGEA